MVVGTSLFLDAEEGRVLGVTVVRFHRGVMIMNVDIMITITVFMMVGLTVSESRGSHLSFLSKSRQGHKGAEALAVLGTMTVTVTMAKAILDTMTVTLTRTMPIMVIVRR